MSRITIGSVVANMNHKTIGVVLDIYLKDGDARTDADGVVPIKDLILYNTQDHKDYGIAPSTIKYILDKTISY